MFVEVTRRQDGKPLLVNTDHVRSITWSKSDEGDVVGFLNFAKGDRVVITFGNLDEKALWSELKRLSGVALQQETL